MFQLRMNKDQNSKEHFELKTKKKTARRNKTFRMEVVKR